MSVIWWTNIGQINNQLLSWYMTADNHHFAWQFQWYLCDSLSFPLSHENPIWVRSWNCGCLVTWFCYLLIAKPGNKTAIVPWPDPYAIEVSIYSVRCWYNAINFLQNHHKKHCIARPLGQDMGFFCRFELWFVFCYGHCSNVWNIKFYWTVL